MWIWSYFCLGKGPNDDDGAWLVDVSTVISVVAAVYRSAGLISQGVDIVYESGFSEVRMSFQGSLVYCMYEWVYISELGLRCTGRDRVEKRSRSQTATVRLVAIRRSGLYVVVPFHILVAMFESIVCISKG